MNGLLNSLCYLDLKDLEKAASNRNFAGDVTDVWENDVDDLTLINMLFFADSKIYVHLSNNPGLLCFLKLPTSDCGQQSF